MILLSVKVSWLRIIKVFLLSFSIILFFAVITGSYLAGYIGGYNNGIADFEKSLTSYFEVENISIPTLTPTVVPKPTSIIKATPSINKSLVAWGGPELWQEVNKKRQEYGVNPLGQRDELCTIASIRLNELLELDKLDGHEGFSNLSDRRPDLAWIFEKYSVVAEFLAMGGETAQETVELWNNTLGHKKLLEGGEYVWGCIYAQNAFAVAITAY